MSDQLRIEYKYQPVNDEIARDAVSGAFASLTTSHFGAILADPPWRFHNRTGQAAPEHRRLWRYSTMTVGEIAGLRLDAVAAANSHLYLWVPNALLAEGLHVMRAWGFNYKTNLVWHKVRKDGGSDGGGVGFYFRNVTELILFGVRGSLRTLPPGRRQINLLAARKREHSRKPDELYRIIEARSPGPWLELFARHERPGWKVWGNEVPESRRSGGSASAGNPGHLSWPSAATPTVPCQQRVAAHLPQLRSAGRPASRSTLFAVRGSARGAPKDLEPAAARLGVWRGSEPPEPSGRRQDCGIQ